MPHSGAGQQCPAGRLGAHLMRGRAQGRGASGMPTRRSVMTFATPGTQYAFTLGGFRLSPDRGPWLKAGIPAKIIVGSLKKIRRCLVGKSMHLREPDHGLPLGIDQAGAIRVGSLCQRRLRTRLSPIFKLYSLLTAPSREHPLNFIEHIERKWPMLCRRNVETSALEICAPEIDLKRL